MPSSGRTSFLRRRVENIRDRSCVKSRMFFLATLSFYLIFPVSLRSRLSLISTSLYCSIFIFSPSRFFRQSICLMRFLKRKVCHDVMSRNDLSHRRVFSDDSVCVCVCVMRTHVKHVQTLCRRTGRDDGQRCEIAKAKASQCRVKKFSFQPSSSLRPLFRGTRRISVDYRAISCRGA